MILTLLLSLFSFMQPQDSATKNLQLKPDSTQAQFYMKQVAPVWGNWPVVDSLASLAFEAAARANRDDLRARAAAMLATAQRFSDPRGSGQWADTCIYYSKRIKNLSSLGTGYRMKGYSLTNTHKIDHALEQYLAARKCFDDAQDTTKLIEIYLDLSLHYHNNIKDYNTGKRYGLDGLALIEKSGITTRLWYLNNAVAINYDDNNEPREALKYHYLNLDKPDSARISETYNNIGNTLLKTGNANESLVYFLKSLKAVRRFNSPERMNYDYATLYNNMSCVYAELGKWALSETYRDSAIYFAHRSNDMEKLYDAYRDAAVNSERNNKFREANLYLKKFIALKDSVFSSERAGAVSDFEVQYETQKKEAEIALLKSSSTIKDLRLKQAQNVMAIVIITTLLVGLLILYLIKRRSQAEKVKRAIENEEHQRRQFAAVLEGGEKERIRIAKELHDGVGQLLSIAKLSLTSIDPVPDNEKLLANATQTLDDATREVRAVSHNLMPAVLSQLGLFAALRDLVEKINRSGKVTVYLNAIGLEQRLTETAEIHIYRILQEVTNNIIKHSDAKEITIVLDNKDDSVKIEIKDDGRAVNESVLRNGTGLGWKNILSRVAMLNGKINLTSGLSSGNNLQIQLSANGR